MIKTNDFINKTIETNNFINKSIIVSIKNSIKIIDTINDEIAISQGFKKLKLQFLKLKTKYVLRKLINLKQKHLKRGVLYELTMY